MTARNSWTHLEQFVGLQSTQQVIEDCTQPSASTSIPEVEDTCETRAEHHDQRRPNGDLITSPELEFGTSPTENLSPVIGSNRSPPVRRKLFDSVRSSIFEANENLIIDVCTQDNDAQRLAIDPARIQPACSNAGEIQEASAASRTLTSIQLSLPTLRSLPGQHLPDSQAAAASCRSSSSSCGSLFELTCNEDGVGKPRGKRTQYKRDGFAWKAMQAIKEQRGRAMIWRHENAKKRAAECRANEAQNLIVNDVICEFNRCILVCTTGNKSRCLLLLPSTDGFVGAENALKGKWIRLFPPYSRKFIDYKGSVASFYYNTCRMLCSPEIPNPSTAEPAS